MIALDLFAGTGWGVACQWLGIEENGVEIMTEAVATRSANGMKTIYNDVWDGLNGSAEPGYYDILIASPPCQTFSVAGSGSGRAALDDVLGLIDAKACQLEGDGLRERASELGMDDRTALVLAPLAYAYRHKPRFIALEQVPTVLPVWKRIAEELKSWGYSVRVFIAMSDEYGVPQTRKRAILTASRDTQIALPAKSDQKVSMEKVRPNQSGVVSNYSTRGSAGVDRPNNARKRGYRPITSPCFTLTSKALSMVWLPSEEKLTMREACLIQGYPIDFDISKMNAVQVGNAVPPPLAKAILQTFIDQDRKPS